ncbi:MAG: 6-bladed beta-propeller [Candidatus Aminicenantes bacterium]|nr:6-bladed beta-propeller [Candidatus Aminicenantes bacterium]
MRKKNDVIFLAIFFICIFYGIVSPTQLTFSQQYKNGRLELRPILSIDDTILPERIVFENPTHIAFDDANNVYVSDYRACHILKFDQSGRFIKLIGQRGEGPGDLMAPAFIAITKETVVVYDIRSKKFSTFTRDGEFIQQFSYLNEAGCSVKKIRSLSNGCIAIEIEKKDIMALNKPCECYIDIVYPNFKVKKSINLGNTLDAKCVRNNTGTISFSLPFSPRFFWDVEPNVGLVIGNSKNYKIKIFNEEGVFKKSFDREYEQIKVNRYDKISYLDKYVGRIEKKAPNTAKTIRENIEFPSVKPAFHGLFLDPSGHILTCLYQEKREDDNSYYDCFDSNGKYINMIKAIGAELSIVHVNYNEKSLWGIELSDEGIYKIVKYGLTSIK